MKKIGSLLCVCALMLTLLTGVPMSASAAYSADGLWEYDVLADGTAEITYCYDFSEELVVPSKIDGYTVTAIGEEGMYYCSAQSITLPSTLKTIKDKAFYGSFCLTSITIPASVTAIGGQAFAYCDSLETVMVESGNTAYVTVDGVLFDKAKTTLVCYPAAKTEETYTVPDTVALIGDGAFAGATLSTITLPTDLRAIGNSAFEWCYNLESLTLPSQLTSIGDGAFGGCGFETITIPASVAVIGNDVFAECYSLEEILVASGNTAYCDVDGVLYNKQRTILVRMPCAQIVKTYIVPSTVTAIADGAFASCYALNKVTLPAGLQSIGDAAFFCCDIKSIDLPVGLKTIGAGAFCLCTFLTEITIPSTVTTIGDSAFCTAPLTSIVIPNSVTSLGEMAFANCMELTSVTLSNALTSIEMSAFLGCTALTSITIPNGVQSIGEDAFESCSALKTITIPASVTTIGMFAFDECTALTDVYYGGTAAQWSAIEIAEANEPLTTATIHYNDKPTTVSFPDVKSGAWYYDAVQYVAQKGYMTGFASGKFGPAANMQRQDFVVTLSRIAGADLTKYQGKTGGLKDVSKNAYYAPAVAWAVDKGIVTGYNNGKFGVGDPITREQVCTIFYRYEGSPKVSNVDSTLKAYPDSKKISAFAKDAVAWASQNGVMSGMADGKFSPTTNASRAQVATIVMRMDQANMF